MRPFPAVQIVTGQVFLLLFLVNISHSTALPSSKDLKVCSVYARVLTDLYSAQDEIRASIKDETREIVEAKDHQDRLKAIANENLSVDRLNEINNIIRKYEERLKSTCPGMGYKCKTFLSRSERNVCTPFKIETSDIFVFENTTYE